MPVANLQSYRTVALSVRSTAFASQGYAVSLERAVLQKLQRTCGFEQIGRASATPADVVLDLNITNTTRSSGGWVAGSTSATIDTLLVLTDGESGDLLGTARIHGKSSGMGGAEGEAVEVVAKTVADVLAKSGCSGPRIARAEPPPTPPGPGPGPGSGSGEGSAAPPDEAKRAEAEALNEQGKLKLRSADVEGAIATFQQANTVVPDARYVFNLCMAFGAAERWDHAIAACRQARGMNPEERLAMKIDERLEMLQRRK